MRKSTIKGEKGYDVFAYDFDVMLDGNLLKFCYEADEETGEAWCYNVNKWGHFEIDGDSNRVTVKHTGMVQIVLKLNCLLRGF